MRDDQPPQSADRWVAFARLVQLYTCNSPCLHAGAWGSTAADWAALLSATCGRDASPPQPHSSGRPCHPRRWPPHSRPRRPDPRFRPLLQPRLSCPLACWPWALRATAPCSSKCWPMSWACPAASSKGAACRVSRGISCMHSTLCMVVHGTPCMRSVRRVGAEHAGAAHAGQGRGGVARGLARKALPPLHDLRRRLRDRRCTCPWRL